MELSVLLSTKGTQADSLRAVAHKEATQVFLGTIQDLSRVCLGSTNALGICDSGLASVIIGNRADAIQD